MSLRCHYDFASLSLRFDFDVTSMSRRFHKLPLRAQFGITSISLRPHFDSTKEPEKHKTQQKETHGHRCDEKGEGHGVDRI